MGLKWMTGDTPMIPYDLGNLQMDFPSRSEDPAPPAMPAALGRCPASPTRRL